MLVAIGTWLLVKTLMAFLVVWPKLELEMLAWEQNSMPALVKKADL